MFDQRSLAQPRFSLLGSASGALAFANSQNQAIVAAINAGNYTQAVRIALMTPWNPNPSDAQVQAALADPQNAQNVLLIIQRAGATPAQLASIPQPGRVNYLSPAVQTALKQIQSGGTATPSLPQAAPAPPPSPPAPTPAPAPAPTTSTTSSSAPPATTTGLTPDQIAQIVASMQPSPAAQSNAGTPPAGPTGPGADLTQLLSQPGQTTAPNAAPQTAALPTGPLAFLSQPIALPVIGPVPTYVVAGAAGLAAWWFWRRSRG